MNPQSGDLTGQLDIEQAELRPGPLTSQLAMVVKQIQSLVQRRPVGDLVQSNNPWITLPKQKSEFRVVDRKVHHKRLTFVVDGSEIHTTGSVGFDNTINLVAEIPIQDNWIDNNQYLTSLKGQVIRVPIRGTTKQPQVDRRELAMFAQQMTGSAAKKCIAERTQ